MQQKGGFSLVELLVVLGLIGVLATIVTVAVVPVRAKARDVRRKSDLAQIGRFLSLKCYMPQAGAGDYDVAQLVGELSAANPQYALLIARAPRDPRQGDDDEFYYRYTVRSDGRCALYANLENESESVTLFGINSPTPGGGRGVFESTTQGWNGTRKYFQYSN